MISVQEAKALLQQYIPTPQTIGLPLEKACGYVLAEPIYAPLDVPSFDNSAMDGYAFAWQDYQDGKTLTLKYTIQAGDISLPVLQSGEVARIFTGAPVPQGADTVVMQEKVTVSNNQISIQNYSFEKGNQIRLKASQTVKGEKVADSGIKLTPGIIGFLATLGINEVKVFCKPKVRIIVTGKELVKPGNPLIAGQIYESNSYSLLAALSEMHIDVKAVQWVNDDLTQIYEAIAEALQHSNLLLITGGISVGDYDFVQTALEKAGVEKVFYKVKQKPGKPLYVGRKEQTLVFGLPGNPASVLTCFYEYVKPAIQQMMGFQESTKIILPLATQVKKVKGLTHFMKGKAENGTVTMLEGQESYKMNSFSASNCLIELDEEREMLEKGEAVKVRLIN